MKHFNGIIYLNELTASDDDEFHVLFIQADNKDYKKYIEINSIAIIKNYSMHIADVVNKTGVETPYTYTKPMDALEKKYGVMCYGFNVDGKITEEIISNILKAEYPFKVVDYKMEYIDIK